MNGNAAAGLAPDAVRLLAEVVRADDDHLVEIRSLGDEAHPRVFLTGDQVDVAAAHALAQSEAGLNVYFGVNPRDLVADGERQTGKKENVSTVNALHADLDDDHALDALTNAIDNGLPVPSVAVMSGSLTGSERPKLHVYWLLDVPAAAGTAEPVLKALCKLVEADMSQAHVAGVLRVPGTRNQKPGAGVVKVDEASTWQRYGLDELRQAILYEPLPEHSANVPVGEGETILNGNANNVLFNIGCDLRRKGLVGQVHEDALVEIAVRRCELPPDLDAVRGIAERARGLVERDGIPQPISTADLKKPTDRATDDEPRPLTLDELEALPPPEWLIDGVIPKNALGMGYGPAGIGKTFLFVAAAASVGTGSSFLGIGDAKRCGVLYAAGEGHGGIAVRLRAWTIANRRQGVGLLRVLPGSLDLFSPVGLDRAKRAVDRMPEAPGLIVVDTLARAMAGADENSARDMGIVISNCDELRRYADGATVLLVHHTGKSGEVERGSSALRGAVDFALKLTEDGAGLRLEVDKQKDAKEHDPISLHLREAGASLAIGLGKRWDQWSPQSALILRVVSESFGTDQVSTSNLMAATALPKSTFFRALKPLVDAGVLAREDVGRATYYRRVGFGRTDKSQSVPTGPGDLPATGLTHPPPLGGETSREETPTPLPINPFMTL